LLCKPFEMTANNRLPIAAAVMAAALLATPRADATLARAIDFDTKVADSQAIVLGECTRTESRFDVEHRWILTYTTFRVERSIKGQPMQEITVVTPGGHVGDLHQATIGVPVFQRGDENVVFVKSSAAGPTVAYFDQGAYAVTREGNQRIVTPVPTRAVVVDDQRGMAVATEGPKTLEQFEADVRRADRAAFQRMEVIRERERQQADATSLSSIILRNKSLIVLALLGAVLATWQFLKRS
jgi:hypothetical protein